MKRADAIAALRAANVTIPANATNAQLLALVDGLGGDNQPNSIEDDGAGDPPDSSSGGSGTSSPESPAAPAAVAPIVAPGDADPAPPADSAPVAPSAPAAVEQPAPEALEFEDPEEDEDAAAAQAAINDKIAAGLRPDQAVAVVIAQAAHDGEELVLPPSAAVATDTGDPAFEALVSAKVRAGLTRQQAIDVIGAQARHDDGEEARAATLAADASNLTP